MSIVIATLEENHSIDLFADRRMVVQNETDSYNRTAQVQKIFELSDTISCGMTGDAQWGIELANELMRNHDQLPSKMIEIIKNFHLNMKDHSIFILVGKYDDGDLFIFGFKTAGDEMFIKNKNCCMIATSPLQYTNNCIEFYNNKRDIGHNNEYSCIETIKFASLQNPIYISEEFDHIQIKF